MNAKVAQLWARGRATAKTLSYDTTSPSSPHLANPPPSGDIPETKGALTAETDPIPIHRPTHSSRMILKSSLVTPLPCQSGSSAYPKPHSCRPGGRGVALVSFLGVLNRCPLEIPTIPIGSVIEPQFPVSHLSRTSSRATSDVDDYRHECRWSEICPIYPSLCELFVWTHYMGMPCSLL